jgi:hypothetical protein
VGKELGLHPLVDQFCVAVLLLGFIILLLLECLLAVHLLGPLDVLLPPAMLEIFLEVAVHV